VVVASKNIFRFSFEEKGEGSGGLPRQPIERERREIGRRDGGPFYLVAAWPYFWPVGIHGRHLWAASCRRWLNLSLRAIRGFVSGLVSPSHGFDGYAGFAAIKAQATSEEGGPLDRLPPGAQGRSRFETSTFLSSPIASPPNTANCLSFHGIVPWS